MVKYGRHFSEVRIYSSLSRWWWWRTIYKYALKFSRNCGECTTITGLCRDRATALSHSSAEAFEIIGVYIMELPVTNQGTILLGLLDKMAVSVLSTGLATYSNSLTTCGVTAAKFLTS